MGWVLMAGTGMYWTLSVPWDSDVFMCACVFCSWILGRFLGWRVATQVADCPFGQVSAVSYRPTASNDKTQLPHETMPWYPNCVLFSAKIWYTATTKVNKVTKFIFKHTSYCLMFLMYSNILKYYYYLNELFSILVYYKMLFIPVMEHLYI